MSCTVWDGWNVAGIVITGRGTIAACKYVGQKNSARIFSMRYGTEHKSHMKIGKTFNYQTVSAGTGPL